MQLQWYRVEGRRRASRLLFLIHNYGGNEYQMGLLGSLIDPDGRFAVVCPRGGVDTADTAGGASFYRVDRATHTYDLPSFVTALDALDDALDRACAETGFARHESVVGGYSQGGGLALALAYRRSPAPRPAAVVAFNPPVHPRERVDWDLATAGGTDAFVVHGTEDSTFPAQASRRFVDELTAAGVAATWHGTAARHQLTLEGLAAARDWLAGR